MADTDWLANAEAVLALMTKADAATHTMRQNSIDELSQIAATSMLVQGAVNMTEWDKLKSELEGLKNSSAAAATALAQAATIKANSPPLEELMNARTLINAIATGLAGAVAQFTVTNSMAAAVAPPSSTAPTSGV